MGATFSRIKNWTTEVLSNSDLNAEIDNILNNLGPAGVDDYSTNAAQMRLTTDPGEVGTESLATSLSGEIERLRHQIKEMKGSDVAQWYTSSSYSLSTLGASFGGGLPSYRVISGRNRTASSQAIALVPAGNARTATLKGSVTSYVYAIANTQYNITADVNITALTTAAATNNTCLINDDGLAGEEHTKYIGEYDTDLIVDNMGSGISALTGKLAGFSLVSGGSTEYFVARVESSTRLTGINRGFFFDSADAPISRIACSDNNTISLMKLTWLFANTAGTLVATYNEPRVSKEEPSSPAAGDYWFDISSTAWKTFSSAWANASATLVGYCMQNTTATMAARSIDYFKAHDDVNNIDLMIYDSTEIRSTRRGCRVTVYGSAVYFEEDYVRWDMDTDLDTGVSETANTQYFLYVSEAGKPIISTVAPSERPDFKGMYHPSHTWRCVGQAFNDASSNFTSVISYLDTGESNFQIANSVASNALILRMQAPPQSRFQFRNATSATAAPQYARVLPGHNMTVAAGSTLGTEDALDATLLQYGLSYNGRVEPGISREVFNSDFTQNSTAEAGNGDSGFTLYSKYSRTSVPVRTFASMVSNQTNAGTWASTPTNIAPLTSRTFFTRSVVFTASSTNLVVPSGVQQMNFDLVGAGGGGGGGGLNLGASNNGAGGGGGESGTRIIGYLTVLSNETLTMSCGGGGAGGAGATTTASGSAVAGSTGTAASVLRNGTIALTAIGGRGGSGAQGAYGSVGGAGGGLGGGAGAASASGSAGSIGLFYYMGFGSGTGGGGGGAGDTGDGGAGAASPLSNSTGGVGGTANNSGQGGGGGAGPFLNSNGGNGGNGNGTTSGNGVNGSGFGSGGGGGSGVDKAGGSVFGGQGGTGGRSRIEASWRART